MAGNRRELAGNLPSAVRPRMSKVGPIGLKSTLFQTGPSTKQQEKPEFSLCEYLQKKEGEEKQKNIGVMDLSPIKEAVAAGNYMKVGFLCDKLMLEAAADGIAYQEEWPFAIHLLGHLYVSDFNSSRFLWKTIPSPIKESQPELVAVWKIAQKLWTRDYPHVYEAIRGFEWSPEVKLMVDSFSKLYMSNMLELIHRAYSTISVHDTALLLGMNEDDATNYVVKLGWILDPSSRMLTVKKPSISPDQKLDRTKLQRLTEYVFHLEH